MDKPICLKCGAHLTGRVRYHFTTCPSCGKRWQLNEANTAIHGTTLEVQSVVHGQRSTVIGDKENG